MEVGHLSDSQCEGTIILLPNSRKVLLLVENYRPITLLNNDHKIIASVLNNCMKNHLSNLIQPEQNDFIKDRHIGDNICLLFDVIDLAEANDIPGSVLTVDIFKAFDSLNWNFYFV